MKKVKKKIRRAVPPEESPAASEIFVPGRGKLAGFEKFRPAPVEFRPPPPEELTWVFSGKLCTGKTNLILGIPEAAICDFDGKGYCPSRGNPSSAVFGGKGALALTMEDWERFFNELYRSKKAGTCPFQVVVIDTISAMISLATDYFTRVYANKVKAGRDYTKVGQEGMGHAEINSYVMRLLQMLVNAGFGLVITAHEEFKENYSSNQSVLVRSVTIKPGVLRWVKQVADYWGTVYSEVKVMATKVNRKVKGSDKTLIDVERSTRIIYGVTFENDSTGAGDPSAERRQQIPLSPDMIDVTNVNGWDAIRKAYLQGIEDHRDSM